VSALPSYVFAAFAAAVPTTLADGSTWVQTLSGGAWWAKHTSSGGSVVFYECDFSGSGFAGLPSNGETKEKAMTMQTQGLGAVSVGGVNTIRKQTHVASPSMTQGLGAVFVGAPRGRSIGVGMPGPDFGKDSELSAGTYEITGTEVALFSDNAEPPKRGTLINPSTPGVIAFFNTAYGDNGGKIAGAPDQVDVATTEVRNGRRYALVSVKSAAFAGQKDPSHPDATNVSPGNTGLVATDYIAPVGWTASHGGTGPVPNKSEPLPEPPPDGTTTAAAKSSSAIPWIVGGLVLAGIIVGGALVGKKGYRRAKAHVRLHRMKSRKRAYA
jgi:hypothetical protein